MTFMVYIPRNLEPGSRIVIALQNGLRQDACHVSISPLDEAFAHTVHFHSLKPDKVIGEILKETYYPVLGYSVKPNKPLANAMRHCIIDGTIDFGPQIE